MIMGVLVVVAFVVGILYGSMGTWYIMHGVDNDTD